MPEAKTAAAGVNILALDLGTRTGWALTGHTVTSGVQVFDVKRGESPGMRYLRFARWLDEILGHGLPMRMYLGAGVKPQIEREPLVKLIVYEAPHHRGGAATEIALGFSTTVQAAAAHLGIEHASVHSATLKKFTTGSGRGEKVAMYSAAVKRGWIPTNPRDYDDNEVDAICLLHYALAEIVPTARRPGGG